MSKTSKETNETKTATYVSGSLHTKYFTDDIYIGNPNNGAIRIKDVKFGVALENSTLIEDIGVDAIIGMTAHNHMDPKIPTLMQTLKDQKLLGSNLYAIDYDLKNNNSEVTFGYYDKTKYKGEIEWYPNNSTNFFTIHLDDVLFGNRSMKHAFC